MSKLKQEQRRAKRLTREIAASGDGFNNEQVSFHPDVPILSDGWPDFSFLKPWIEAFLFVVPFDGGRPIKMKLFPEQDDLNAHVVEQLNNRKPVRTLVPKSRQLGISQYVQALDFCLTYNISYLNCATVAHRADTGQAIFRRNAVFWRGLPLQMREQRKLFEDRVHKNQYAFEQPHGSRHDLFTSGADVDIGRGFTIHSLHITEWALFRDDDDNIVAMMNAVVDPIRNWFSLVFGESTGKGPRGEFYDKCMEATDPERRSPWDLKFYTWKNNPIYQIPIEPHEQFTLDETEQKFAEQYSLSLPQMKWARYNRSEKCKGQWAKFNQENPVAMELAFQSYSTAVFDPVLLGRLITESKHKRPVFRGEIQNKAVNAIEIGLAPMDWGPLMIWSHPEPGKTYSLGADPSHGIGKDYSSIIVLEDDTGRLVAHFYQNTIKPQAFSKVCYLLGAYFNWATLGFESTAVGEAMYPVLLGEVGGEGYEAFEHRQYEPLYRHRKLKVDEHVETDMIGWPAQKKTIRTAIGHAITLLSEGDWICHSIRLLQQMSRYEYDLETDKYTCYYKDDLTDAFNDDCLRAFLISNVVRVYALSSRASHVTIHLEAW